MSFRKSSISRDEHFRGHHRFEHWYRDNTIYFITARCRGRHPAFKSEQAKVIFWNRFDHYSAQYQFVPLVTTLLDNHYHSLLYARVGENLGPMMRHIHGSVAKLVNDLLPERLTPFWYDAGKQGYFDGCIRDELQHRRAHWYVLIQARRHGVAVDYRAYAHTIERVKIESAVKRARELRSYMKDVPYKRYERLNKWRDKTRGEIASH